MTRILNLRTVPSASGTTSSPHRSTPSVDPCPIPCTSLFSMQNASTQSSLYCHHGELHQNLNKCWQRLCHDLVPCWPPFLASKSNLRILKEEESTVRMCVLYSPVLSMHPRETHSHSRQVSPWETWGVQAPPLCPPDLVDTRSRMAVSTLNISLPLCK